MMVPRIPVILVKLQLLFVFDPGNPYYSIGEQNTQEKLLLNTEVVVRAGN
jgi:hypothetical protein